MKIEESNKAWTEESLRELFTQHNVPYVESNGVITIDTKSISNFNQKAYTVLYPVCFHTVDIAVVRPGDNDTIEVLVAQKHAEVDSNKWRFPGGFMDPNETAYFSAARELKEECAIEAREDEMFFIDSIVIDDLRMRNSPHSITTSLHFYFAPDNFGQDKINPIPGDDIAKLKWIQLSMENLDEINEIHKPLFTRVIAAIDEFGQAFSF